MQDDFLQDYLSYVEGPLGDTADRVSQTLESTWTSKGYWAEHAGDSPVNPMPIQRIRIRIKEPDRVLSKYRRLGTEFPGGATPDNLRKMRDLLGARIITYFQANIALIDKEIRSERNFRIAEEFIPRSYVDADVLRRIGLNPTGFDVKGRKPSGYSSIHYFLNCLNPEGAVAGPIFELQVRTMAEEVWGEVEHQLAYRPDGEPEAEVRDQFRVIGKHLGVIDEHFDSLLSQLTRQQSLSEPDAEDTLDAENLPAVLQRIGFSSEQDQLSYMLDLLATNNIVTVGQLDQAGLGIPAERIREKYKESSEAAISALSFVHILSQLSFDPEPDEIDRTVKRQVVLDEYARERQQAPRVDLCGIGDEGSSGTAPRRRRRY